MLPLEGLSVIDFSTLLPGPLASLILAEAGADVIKIERPSSGDEMRTYQPRVGEDSANFVMLNRGKRSLAVDLKQPEVVARVRALIERADVLIEQFRPGVMDRLGLGFDAMHSINPKLVYCSISGWGQTGPKASVAGHDLNYLAETGILGLSAGADGAPVLPPVLAADIAGGAFPAVMNIMFALRERDRTGEGVRLDISMADNLFAFHYWSIGSGASGSGWPKPGAELVTGGSPRYHIYPTADGRYLAAAPVEEKFWQRFCQIIGLTQELRGTEIDQRVVIAEVRRRITEQTSAYWRDAFAGQDVCCSIVATLEEAMSDPHVIARGLFDHKVKSGEATLPALPVPVAPVFRSIAELRVAPSLGDSNQELLNLI
ncbi:MULTISPECIES: CaiB/BaiF CoA transferase family protein [Paraburkholderia]|jgi:crotonobetainyl-CoA:carnitine CoA-transferase CaiB-like acyl-CoA transferase|uniref:CaiB/BaiF CoA transferase family protein n=1 Tax=Paraburkholderia TaxID=1822464 RepID=UPI0038B9F09E